MPEGKNGHKVSDAADYCLPPWLRSMLSTSPGYGWVFFYPLLTMCLPRIAETKTATWRVAVIC